VRCGVGGSVRTVLEYLAAAFMVGVLVASLASCTNEARVQFQSCEEAAEAGASLPLTAADPGWNVHLDTDGDGRAC
jgi:hypothetical protein